MSSSQDWAPTTPAAKRRLQVMVKLWANKAFAEGNIIGENTTFAGGNIVGELAGINQGLSRASEPSPLSAQAGFLPRHTHAARYLTMVVKAPRSFTLLRQLRPLQGSNFDRSPYSHVS